MRRIAAIALFLVAIALSNAVPQMETVYIEKPQLAQAVAGFVTDPTGAPIEGVLVEERSSDWKTVLRSATTDDKGSFHLSSKHGQKDYQLQFGKPGFNWMRIVVRLDKHGEKHLLVKLPIGT